MGSNGTAIATATCKWNRPADRHDLRLLRQSFDVTLSRNKGIPLRHPTPSDYRDLAILLPCLAIRVFSHLVRACRICAVQLKEFNLHGAYSTCADQVGKYADCK